MAVRLEGGIGDHVLGMRLLPFIRRAYPQHDIVAYSDCMGQQDQLQVAAMSPLLARVVPIRQNSEQVTWENMGFLSNVDTADLDRMGRADVFFDAFSAHMCIPQAMMLRIPIDRILSHRPKLIVPLAAERSADDIVSGLPGTVLVGMNMGKYGPAFLRSSHQTLIRLLHPLLEDPRVVILNMFVSAYAFAHWPEPKRSGRAEAASAEAELLAGLSENRHRIVPLVDLPITTVAALLRRCVYFVGVDNGIKHLAWAMRIPVSFFCNRALHPLFVFRWVPDVERVLPVEADEGMVAWHVAEARRAIQNCRAQSDLRDEGTDG